MPGGSSANQPPDIDQEDEKSSPDLIKALHGSGPKLTFWPLVALIYFEVSGGPYGVEDVVGAGGPLLTILGFLIFPLIWSVPEALITAELATAFPENGGYVVWVTAAFGEFWGFQQGWWKWLSGVIDNSLYAVLFLDYSKAVVPALGGGFGRVVALNVIVFLLTYLNYRGLTIVGSTAVALGIFGFLPFLALSIIALPRIQPMRWLEFRPGTISWRGYMNSIFWNLNYWDSVSTLAGEVEKPRKQLPPALFVAVVLVVASYLIPLMVGTGAAPVIMTEWRDGYFAQIAYSLGGPVLRWWLVIAAASSNIGMFEAEMSSDSFQLLGMSERGMLPELFAIRSKHGTPTAAILFSASGVLFLSWLNFAQIVELLNFLYCLGMLCEFAAYIWLRIKEPDIERPYKVPLNTTGVIIMSAIPVSVLLWVMSLASKYTMAISLVASVLGFMLQPLLVEAKKHGWCKFMVDPALPDLEHLEHERQRSSEDSIGEIGPSRSEDARPMLSDARGSEG